jgi:hypothetical protein
MCSLKTKTFVSLNSVVIGVTNIDENLMKVLIDKSLFAEYKYYIVLNKL